MQNKIVTTFLCFTIIYITIESKILSGIRGKENVEPGKDQLEKLKVLLDKFFLRFPKLKTEEFIKKLSGPSARGLNFEWITDKKELDPDWLLIKDTEEFKELDTFLDNYYLA